jgi:hypothetical protein
MTTWRLDFLHPHPGSILPAAILAAFLLPTSLCADRRFLSVQASPSSTGRFICLAPGALSLFFLDELTNGGLGLVAHGFLWFVVYTRVEDVWKIDTLNRLYMTSCCL